MHISSGLITSLLTFVGFAAPSLALEPWQIRELTILTPSDLGTLRYSVLNVTLSDPNSLAATPIRCTSRWTPERPPFGVVYDCSASREGKWSFSMLKPDDGEPSPTTNFKLRFEQKKESETLAGTASFREGKNLIALCSAREGCTVKLRDEYIPFPVRPTVEKQ
ncbi:hypothetical protein VTH06DRAFT_4004 [Thermothelomyces fergusii]